MSAAAFLEYLLEDPHTAIVGGFIEAIREPERFAAALDRAGALGKPVVMVKVGRHERTRRAITTHTGGDADDSAAVSPAQLFETSAAPQCAWQFTRLQRRVARHRLGGSFLLGRLAGAHAVEFEHRVPRLGLDEEVRQCPNKRVNAVW